MKVLVIDTAARPGTGVFSVLEDTYAQALVQDEGVEWIFMIGGPYLRSRGNVQVVVRPLLQSSRLFRIVFELFFGSCYVKKLHPDVVLSLQNTPIMGLDVRQFVSLQQTLYFAKKNHPFSFFVKSERKLAFYQKIIGPYINFMIKHSKSTVIVQTKWLKTILLEKNIKKSSRDIVVIPPQIGDSVHNADLDKTKVSKNTFFFPGAALKYKNHKLIIDAVRRLVTSGITNFSVNLTISAEELEMVSDSHQKLIIPKEVNCLGKITRKQVWNFLKSSVLIFPSYIESYGLPLLEAEKMGTMILAARTGPTMEILDSYANAYFFSPTDSEQLAQLMKKCIEDDIEIVSTSTAEVHQPNLNLTSYICMHP